MTLRQLEYILAVARAGSFTRAAQDLHVAQPSLSQQIRALESEVGGPLLERPPGPVRLTPAGRALAAEGRTAASTPARWGNSWRWTVTPGCSSCQARMHSGRADTASERTVQTSRRPA